MKFLGIVQNALLNVGLISTWRVTNDRLPNDSGPASTLIDDRDATVIRWRHGIAGQAHRGDRLLDKLFSLAQIGHINNAVSYFAIKNDVLVRHSRDRVMLCYVMLYFYL